MHLRNLLMQTKDQKLKEEFYKQFDKHDFHCCAPGYRGCEIESSDDPRDYFWPWIEHKLAEARKDTGLKDANHEAIKVGDKLTPLAYRSLGKDEYIAEVVFSKGMYYLKPNGALIQEIRPLYQSLELGRKANNPYIIIN
jgi:hypothetical protein